MKLTERSSTEDRANASLWEHCSLLSKELSGVGLAEGILDLLALALGVMFAFGIILTMPISFPVVAYFNRREARQRLAEFKARLNPPKE